MPVQNKKSSLAAKLGAKGKAAIDKHREDDTDYGVGAQLPEGIEGGIAQLVDCKFDVYEKGNDVGQYYFYAAGTIVEPIEHGGIHVQGLRTSIMEPMCDTPTRSRKTTDEHIAWVLNEMRKLGIETKEVGLEDMEGIAEMLKEAKPFFRFRTWKGEPAKTGAFAGKPARVQHNWLGLYNYVPDGTEPTDTDDGSAATDEEAPADDTAAEGEVDIDALVEAATNDDAEAQEQLTTIATEAGVSAEDIENSESWEAVKEMIEAAGGDETEPEPEPIPAKDEVYKYKVGKSLIQCSVTAVNAKAKTVTLKNLKDGKSLYKSVPFDALKPA